MTLQLEHRAAARGSLPVATTVLQEAKVRERLLEVVDRSDAGLLRYANPACALWPLPFSL